MSGESDAILKRIEHACYLAEHAKRMEFLEIEIQSKREYTLYLKSMLDFQRENNNTLGEILKAISK